MTDAVDKADEAAAAACCLRDCNHSAWALVPLFYSAMHLLHAKFALDPAVPRDRKCPGRHRSQRNHVGAIVTWGMNDTVTAHTPPDVSRCYKSLFNAGHVVRYDLTLLGPQGLDRFWTEYQVIADYCRS